MQRLQEACRGLCVSTDRGRYLLAFYEHNIIALSSCEAEYICVHCCKGGYLAIERLAQHAWNGRTLFFRCPLLPLCSPLLRSRSRLDLSYCPLRPFRYLPLYLRTPSRFLLYLTNPILECLNCITALPNLLFIFLATPTTFLSTLRLPRITVCTSSDDLL